LVLLQARAVVLFVLLRLPCYAVHCKSIDGSLFRDLAVHESE
jgi:hypothetical protein